MRAFFPLGLALALLVASPLRAQSELMASELNALAASIRLLDRSILSVHQRLDVIRQRNLQTYGYYIDGPQAFRDSMRYLLDGVAERIDGAESSLANCREAAIVLDMPALEDSLFRISRSVELLTDETAAVQTNLSRCIQLAYGLPSATSWGSHLEEIEAELDQADFRFQALHDRLALLIIEVRIMGLDLAIGE